jgi:hypothetical protein
MPEDAGGTGASEVQGGDCLIGIFVVLTFEDRHFSKYLKHSMVQEEKQRALLQLQWKVMGESQQVDQEVNSKKVLSTHQVWIRS